MPDADLIYWSDAELLAAKGALTVALKDFSPNDFKTKPKKKENFPVVLEAGAAALNEELFSLVVPADATELNPIRKVETERLSAEAIRVASAAIELEGQMLNYSYMTEYNQFQSVGMDEVGDYRIIFAAGGIGGGGLILANKTKATATVAKKFRIALDFLADIVIEAFEIFSKIFGVKFALNKAGEVLKKWFAKPGFLKNLLDLIKKFCNGVLDAYQFMERLMRLFYKSGFLKQMLFALLLPFMSVWGILIILGMIAVKIAGGALTAIIHGAVVGALIVKFGNKLIDAPTRLRPLF